MDYNVVYDELEKLRDELKDFQDSVISYSPLCKECLKRDIYSPGCFHEDVQAWVCCTKRKVSPGCGAVILTAEEYRLNKSKQGGLVMRGV